MKIRSNYFYGNEVSEYGQQCGYVDYKTLARAFDAVLCNDVTKLFYSTINGEYTEPEQINGFIDNSEAIEELREELEAIEEVGLILDLICVITVLISRASKCSQSLSTRFLPSF